MNFFGNVISTINTLDNVDQYAVCNFNGQHSLSKPENITAVTNYIINTMGLGGCTYCDVGGAGGILANSLLNKGFDAYCIDGSDYGVKNSLISIPKDRYAVFDMAGDIKPYISKPFDVVTSFEILEHIPKSSIKNVLRNLKHISKVLICSIHYSGAETANHYNIKPLRWWTRMFETMGKVEVIHINGIINFDESSFVKVVF